MSEHSEERRIIAERRRELNRAQARRALLWTVTRCLVGVALVFSGYYLVTFDERRPSGTLAVLEIILGGVLFAVVLTVEVRAVAKAHYPVLRALEATVISLFLFIVIFATTYLTLSHNDQHSFTEHLNRTAALYFTIVTLGTVGYGDIAPSTQPARLVVSLQILLDLVFLAALLRVVVAAARRGLTRVDPANGDAAASDE
jgi:voltage-gated potassium channel